MAISFGSINTGLPKDIVKRIIEAERIPIGRMEERKDKFNSKKLLVTELTNLVSGIKGDLLANSNARSLRELKVETNEKLINVELDKNLAKPGNYQIEVLELAQKSSAMSSGFEDPDESYVGVGFIQYTLPNGDTKDVFIDSDHASLRGIAKLINRDESNGLSATVINDGSGSDEPWRLTLSLSETGDKNKAEFPYFYFIDGDHDFYLEFEREAKDAKVMFNGFEVEYPSNKIDDLIPGAVIDLKKAMPGEEFSINISEDIEAISTKVTDIIDKVNAVLAFIKQQNTLDENSDTSRTLGGDILLQTLEARLRNVVFRDIQTSSGPKKIGQLGITFQRNGLLKIDQKRFENLLAQDYGLLSEILTGIYTEEGKIPGFVDNMREVVDIALRQPDGLLPARTRSLQTNINQIDRRIANKERTLQRKEENLKAKFARLESTISKLKGQSAGLGALGASANNPVQQLG